MTNTSNKSMMGLVLSMVVIGVLFIPAYTTWHIEDRTTSVILEVEGLYENGTAFVVAEPFDHAQFEAIITGETIVLDQANNDSVYFKEKTGFGNDIAYTDSVAYIGNGTYACTPNYTIHDDTPIYDWLGIWIEFNMTNAEILDFDFIRITSNHEHASVNLVWSRGWTYDADPLIYMENNEWLYVVGLVADTKLKSYPQDDTMYLLFDGQTPTALNQSDITFNFKVEGFNLLDEHQFFWQDEHLFTMSLVATLFILGITVTFASEIIDIKIDKKKGGNK